MQRPTAFYYEDYCTAHDPVWLYLKSEMDPYIAFLLAALAAKTKELQDSRAAAAGGTSK